VETKSNVTAAFIWEKYDICEKTNLSSFDRILWSIFNPLNFMELPVQLCCRLGTVSKKEKPGDNWCGYLRYTCQFVAQSVKA